MSIIETRLFELACKGERLDAINAEEILDRRAAAQAKATARWLAAQRWTKNCSLGAPRTCSWERHCLV